MTNFEKDAHVANIVEQFRNFEIMKDVAERELKLLGLNEAEIKMALGAKMLFE